MEAKQTPLIELLERVPQDARVVIEHDQFSSSSHPVGRLCHEAAAALRAALAEPEQEPSGSFVLWENTLCNPLSDPRSMAHSAWHDGYASAKVERKPLSEDEIVRLMVGEDRAKLLSAGEFAEGAVRELVESGRAIERAHGIGEQDGS